MMASHHQKKDTNPFLEDEEEVDDFTFLSHPQQGSSGYMLHNQYSGGNYGSTKKLADVEQRRKQLLQERREIEERTLQSSHQSLRLVYETEKVGLETAEELVSQGEKLRNVEQKVDQINTNMRLSQKHINAMKSVFGSVKSYFSRSGNTDPNNTKSPLVQVSNEPAEGPQLQQTISKLRDAGMSASSQNHPAFRSRGIDPSGFGSGWGDDGFDDKTALKSSEFTEEDAYAARSREIDKKLDKNLEELGMGVGRLKMLASALGEEIDEQNDLLDRVTGKVERADDTIQHQNYQIRRILKK